MDPRDPDIRLILSTVYQMNNEQEAAISELQQALKYSPSHVKILYNLSELYSVMPGQMPKQTGSFMLKTCRCRSANVVPRLNLTDIYIRKGEYDKAIEQLEILKKQYPAFPSEAGIIIRRQSHFFITKTGQKRLILLQFFKISLKYLPLIRQGL
jgi:tetratricopeptide (TPR) repeat protein